MAENEKKICGAMAWQWEHPKQDGQEAGSFDQNDNLSQAWEPQMRLSENSEKISKFMCPCVDVFMCTQVTVAQFLRTAETGGHEDTAVSRNVRGINTMVLENNNTGFYWGIAKNNTN